MTSKPSKLTEFQKFSPHLSELKSVKSTKRDLTVSPILQFPEYAELMVLLELYGNHVGTLWWIGTRTMERHDRLALLLRKCKLNYRTQKSKRGKTVLFTTYFQALPTIFGTYRPVAAVAQVKLLESWRAETEKASPGRYVAISIPQKHTLEHCIDRFGAAHRTVERPVTWQGKQQEGYLLVSEW